MYYIAYEGDLIIKKITHNEFVNRFTVSGIIFLLLNSKKFLLYI